MFFSLSPYLFIDDDVNSLSIIFWYAKISSYFYYACKFLCGFVIYVVVYSKLKNRCQKGIEKVFKPEIEVFLCWIVLS